MNGIEIKQQNVMAAEAIIPEGKSFLMLNLLRYNEQASYVAGDSFEPCTGREAYFGRYLPAFATIAANYPDIKPFWIGEALAGLVLNEDEKWDNIALISYPNFKAFKSIVESEDYITKALPHRLAALQDFKLVAAIETTIV